MGSSFQLNDLNHTVTNRSNDQKITTTTTNNNNNDRQFKHFHPKIDISHEYDSDDAEDFSRESWQEEVDQILSKRENLGIPSSAFLNGPSTSTQPPQPEFNMAPEQPYASETRRATRRAGETQPYCPPATEMENLEPLRRQVTEIHTTLINGQNAMSGVLMELNHKLDWIIRRLDQAGVPEIRPVSGPCCPEKKPEVKQEAQAQAKPEPKTETNISSDESKLSSVKLAFRYGLWAEESQKLSTLEVESQRAVKRKVCNFRTSLKKRLAVLNNVVQPEPNYEKLFGKVDEADVPKAKELCKRIYFQASAAKLNGGILKENFWETVPKTWTADLEAKWLELLVYERKVQAHLKGEIPQPPSLPDWAGNNQSQ